MLNSLRRPFGITATSLVLGWLALAGFGNAIAIPTILNNPFAPRMFREPVALAAWSLAAGALAYGMAAFIACRSLWRMHVRGPRAFLVWASSVIAIMCIILVFTRLPPDTPIILGIIFLAFTALLLWGWWRYVVRAYARASTNAL
jgi:hypothetical protein